MVLQGFGILEREPVGGDGQRRPLKREPERAGVGGHGHMQDSRPLALGAPEAEGDAGAGAVADFLGEEVWVGVILHSNEGGVSRMRELG